MAAFSSQSDALPSRSALSGQVLRVLEDYLASLERGVPPSPEQLLAQHPELAEPLREYLASLEFLHQAALKLHGSDPVSKDEHDPAELGQLGDFRLSREIGRGGMGVVYEAEQISLSRRVALKVLPFAAALDSKQLQRFKNEAQAAAHLHHNNIVPVFGVGCERGVHYYAMQFIEGLTLAAVITELRLQAGKEESGKRIEDRGSNNSEEAATIADCARADITKSSGPLSAMLSSETSFFRTAANLGLQAAEALEHAHELGVVHRDIKPANLLIDERGKLWITDFGLAHFQSQARLTLSGDLVGTLRYMSPEQALGKRGLVDHRADVYGLGVTLYELLALEPAFTGSDREELLRQIAFEEPCPPRKRNKAIPRELETIVLKAIEKSPEARYATAQELADDLRRFLDHKPIQAKRPTMLQRSSKWCRRNPFLAAALTAVAVSLVLGTVVAWLLAVWALKEAGRASRQAYSLGIRVMQQAWDNHNMAQLHRLLDETAKFPERGFEWYYWQRLAHVDYRTLVGHIGGVSAVAFAPDGERLATGGRDGTARIWDAQSGRELFCLTHRSHAAAVAFGPAGQWLVTGSTDGTAKLWDAATGKLLRTLQGRDTGAVWAVAVMPDGRRVVTGNEDGTARIWDAASGRELITLNGNVGPPNLSASTVGLLGSPQAPGALLASSALYRERTGHIGPVQAVAVTPHGKRVITAGWDNRVVLWDAASGQQLWSKIGGNEKDDRGINSIAVTSDGKRFITAGNDNTARVWNTDTGQELFTLMRAGWVMSVAAIPERQRFVTGTGAAKIWEMTALPDVGASLAGLMISPYAPGPLLAAPALDADVMRSREILSLLGDRGLTCVAVSPDGRRLATASSGSTARVWDMAGGRGTWSFKAHTAKVHSLFVTPDWIVTGSWDGTAKLWDKNSGRLLRTLPGHTGGVAVVALTPDGQRVVTAGGDGMARVWDAFTGDKLQELPADPRELWSLAMTPDGKRLVTGTWQVAQLWDSSSGEKLPVTFNGPSAIITGLAVTPDGQRVVMGCWNDGTTRIFDIHTGRELLMLQESTGAVAPIALSPQKLRVITGRNDGTATVWDAVGGERLLSLEGHTDFVSSIAVTPDERRIVTGSVDGTVRLWDADSGRELLTLNPQTGPVWSVAVTPDGQALISGSEDGTLTMWEAASEEQTAVWAGQDQEVERRRAVWQSPRGNAPGYIQDWLVLGPLVPNYDFTGAKALDCEQLSGEANLRPREGNQLNVSGQEFTWQALHWNEPVLELNRFLEKRDGHRLAYAVCYVHSAAERHDLLLQLGSQSHVKLYLNGQQVYRCTRNGGMDDLDPVVPLTLHKGMNTLVLKTVNAVAGWLVCARFVDREGNPVQGLEVRLIPE